jgi:hypothetical protein
MGTQLPAWLVTGYDAESRLTPMTTRSIFRLALLTAIMLSAACSRFVWNEEPFTPDLAPMTEVVASGGDSIYVLETPSYYLLSEQRATLWNREVVDDVAWRYRALFAESPPMIAIRIDSVASADTGTTFRGVPLSRVTTHRRGDDAAVGKKKDDRERREVQDSVRARLLAGPVLAATTAQAWLSARADSNRLPSWIEIGALRILGAGGAPDRAAMELRANEKAIVPLTTLFAVRSAKPNVTDIARVAGAGQFEVGDNGDVYEGPQRRPVRRDVIPGVSAVFMAQSVSVLAFMHDRDPGLVARLADALPRGNSIESVLASSATLPHDVAGLDAAWRQWLKRAQKAR